MGNAALAAVVVFSERRKMRSAPGGVANTAHNENSSNGEKVTIVFFTLYSLTLRLVSSHICL